MICINWCLVSRINSKKYFNKYIILIKLYRNIRIIIRSSFTPCFFKGDLHRESCRVKGLNTRDFRFRCRIILKHQFFIKRCFKILHVQRTLESQGKGFVLTSRAVLCIQVLIQFRSVKPKCSSGRGYIYSMEGANFLT